MNNTVVNIILAMLLGTLVGLKKEIEKDPEARNNMLGGFRTYALVALLGSLSGLFFQLKYELFSVLLSGGIILIVLLYYASGLIKGKGVGITSEVSAIFTHIIGILCILQPIPLQFIIALTVLVIFIITRKKQIHQISSNLDPHEVQEFTLFAVVALVILPFLPNQSYSLNTLGLQNVAKTINIDTVTKLFSIDLINPFSTWFIVAFFSGLNLFGYLLGKSLGKAKGILISSTIAGFVSSTTVTYSLAIKSKIEKSKYILGDYVAAALSATGSSMLLTMLLVIPISIPLFQKILVPSVLIILGNTAVALILYFKNTKARDIKIHEYEDKNILGLVPAIKFVILLVLLSILSNTMLILFGNTAFIITSAIAAISGIDLVVINLSQLFVSGGISLPIAFATYLIAYFVNQIGKIFYCFTTGNYKFARSFSFYTIAIFLLALIIGIITFQK